MIVEDEVIFAQCLTMELEMIGYLILGEAEVPKMSTKMNSEELIIVAKYIRKDDWKISE